MTKLFFENTDPDAGRVVRIYRLDTLGGIEAPESFTPMDVLGDSVAIDLLPAPRFTCVGVINRAGIIELSGEESIEIKLPNGDGIVANDPDDLIIQLRELGYIVDVLQEYSSTPLISCDGATGIVTFNDEGGWYDPAFPDKTCIIVLTINDEQSIELDANQDYITDAINDNPTFQSYLNDIGLSISGRNKITLATTSDTPTRFKLEIDRVKSEVDPSVNIDAVYTNLVGGAVGYSGPNEITGCLIKTDSVINCIGESNFVEWTGNVNVFGNYELTFNIIDSDGAASTKIVTGYSEFGKNLIAIRNQSPEWPSSVDCNGDGSVRVESNLFNGGDIRVRFAADQGFSFGAVNVQEGSSTVIESVDASDRDVLDFCLHVEPSTEA